jgi:hypothetical protein
MKIRTADKYRGFPAFWSGKHEQKQPYRYQQDVFIQLKFTRSFGSSVKNQEYRKAHTPHIPPITFVLQFTPGPNNSRPYTYLLKHNGHLTISSKKFLFKGLGRLHPGLRSYPYLIIIASPGHRHTR